MVGEYYFFPNSAEGEYTEHKKSTAVQICELLGLPPDRVMALKLEAEAGKVLIVEVKLRYDVI